MKGLIILVGLFYSLSASAFQDPNIVVVLLDDAGFMDFGIYGSDNLTPTINELGKRGTIFNRYYTLMALG